MNQLKQHNQLKMKLPILQVLIVIPMYQEVLREKEASSKLKAGVNQNRRRPNRRNTQKYSVLVFSSKVFGRLSVTVFLENVGIFNR